MAAVDHNVNSHPKKNGLMNDLKTPVLTVIATILLTSIFGQITGLFATKDTVNNLSRDVTDIKNMIATLAPKTDVAQTATSYGQLVKTIEDLAQRTRVLEDDNRDQKSDIAILKTQNSTLFGKLDTFIDEVRQDRETQRLNNQEINFKLSNLINGSSVRLSTDPPPAAPVVPTGKGRP